MLYRTMEIDELISLKDTDKAVVDLMENNGSKLKLVGLKKHQVVEPHTSNHDVCVYVTDGEIEINFKNEDDCTCTSCGCGIPDKTDSAGRKYKIKKGQIFFFEKGNMHSVEALKDTIFLLIKI